MSWRFFGIVRIADFGFVGLLGSELLGVKDFETLRFRFLWVLRSLDFGIFCFSGLSSDPPIPEVGFFDFHLYSGGRLTDPTIRSRWLLRRLRFREASADSRDGSRRHLLLNR